MKIKHLKEYLEERLAGSKIRSVISDLKREVRNQDEMDQLYEGDNWDGGFSTYEYYYQYFTLLPKGDIKQYKKKALLATFYYNASVGGVDDYIELFIVKSQNGRISVVGYDFFKEKNVFFEFWECEEAKIQSELNKIIKAVEEFRAK